MNYSRGDGSYRLHKSIYKTALGSRGPEAVFYMGRDGFCGAILLYTFVCVAQIIHYLHIVFVILRILFISIVRNRHFAV